MTGVQTCALPISGEGTDTATELYWGYGIQVWNDDGDTVYVYDEADQLMVEFSY